jgi:hypothetical protein
MNINAKADYDGTDEEREAQRLSLEKASQKPSSLELRAAGKGHAPRMAGASGLRLREERRTHTWAERNL